MKQRLACMRAYMQAACTPNAAAILSHEVLELSARLAAAAGAYVS